MAKVEEDIICENCDAEFFIQYDDDDALKRCPFCGEYLSEAYIEEDEYEEF